MAAQDWTSSDNTTDLWAKIADNLAEASGDPSSQESTSDDSEPQLIKKAVHNSTLL